MIDWKRVRSATEWGFFYGIVSWLLSTGFSNKIPVWGVWSIILSRTILGLIIGILPIKFSWWLDGLVIGFGLNLIFALIVWLGLGYTIGFWPMLVTGVIFGVLIEWSLHSKEKNDGIQDKK